MLNLNLLVSFDLLVSLDVWRQRLRCILNYMHRVVVLGKPSQFIILIKCMDDILDFVSLYIVSQIMKFNTRMAAFVQVLLVLMALLGFYLKISAVYFPATLAAIGYAACVLVFILFVNQSVLPCLTFCADRWRPRVRMQLLAP